MRIVKKNGFCYAGVMNTIFKYYLRIVFLLFPIAFVPIVIDGFGFGKNLVLMVLALLALLLWVINLFFEKEKVIKTNKLFWLFLIFVGWSGVSFFRLDLGSKMQALMSPTGIGAILSLFILFFVWLQINDKVEKDKQFLFLTISSINRYVIVTSNVIPINGPIILYPY